MKKNILILLSVCWFFTTQAQDYGTKYLTLIKTFDNSQSEIEGSPYLHKDFRLGTIKVEDKQPLDVFLRYKVSEEVIEIKTNLNSNETYKLASTQNAEYKIGPNTYVLDKIYFEGEPIYGYFVEYYHGETVRFLKKPTAKFFEAVIAKTGYQSNEPARIGIESEYYIVFDSGEVENVRLKKRDLRKVFTSKEARNYLSDNRIRSVEDVVSFLSYFDGKKMQ